MTFRFDLVKLIKFINYKIRTDNQTQTDELLVVFKEPFFQYEN